MVGRCTSANRDCETVVRLAYGLHLDMPIFGGVHDPYLIEAYRSFLGSKSRQVVNKVSFPRRMSCKSQKRGVFFMSVAQCCQHFTGAWPNTLAIVNSQPIHRPCAWGLLTSAIIIALSPPRISFYFGGFVLFFIVLRFCILFFPEPLR